VFGLTNPSESVISDHQREARALFRRLMIGLSIKN